MHVLWELLQAMLSGLSVIPGKKKNGGCQMDQAGRVAGFFIWGLILAVLMVASFRACLAEN